jgi:filamentous hemagglutinin family protein
MSWDQRGLTQVTPDSTLGEERSTVTATTTQGIPSELIAGGAKRGPNLFHSFLAFNIRAGEGAYFSNPAGILNILSRVTGSNPSSINGRLGVLGNANLFFLNPNGIVFGPGASLDVKGSFLATTADGIQFGEQGVFSAVRADSPSVLTVEPSALLFNQIAVQPITSQAKLQVPNTQSLLLVGGPIRIEGGQLLALGGEVAVAALSSAGRVELTVQNTDITLTTFPRNLAADITLAKNAVIDVSSEGGGMILLQGHDVTLTDATRVSADTLGSQPGRGTLIRASQLRIAGGAQVSASTFGSGRSGNIEIDVSDRVELVGTNADGSSPSKIANDTQGSGNGGTLTIHTRRLTIRDGARISASTSKQGQGGNILVNAADSVELRGTSPGGRRPSGLSAQTRGSGRSGAIAIKTQKLSVLGGAEVSASTFGSGKGGSISIIAPAGIVISGTAVVTSESGGSTLRRSRIFAGTGQPSDVIRDGGGGGRGGGGGNPTEPSQTATGDGGSITVSSGLIEILAGGQLTTSNEGTGKAGNIEIQTSRLVLNDGNLTATAVQGGGGNIAIAAETIFLTNNSLISTNVFDSTGGGGDITITTDTFVALENSDILATADEGPGGNITITADTFLSDVFASDGPTSTNESDVQTLRSNGRVDINASSAKNVSGQVTVPDVNFLENALDNVNVSFISADQIVASNCLNQDRRNSQFVVLGTGGLAQTPYQSMQLDFHAEEIGSVQASSSQTQPPEPSQLEQANVSQVWRLGDPIQEATGILTTADGRIRLDSKAQTVPLQESQELICR